MHTGPIAAAQMMAAEEGGAPEPVFSADFVAEDYTGDAAPDDFLWSSYYDPGSPVYDEAIDANGLHPWWSDSGMSAKGALLTALVDADGVTFAMYFRLTDITRDTCLLAIYNAAEGVGGATCRAWVQNNALHVMMRDNIADDVQIDIAGVAADTLHRLTVTLTAAEVAVSFNGAAVVSEAGLARPVVYDRADIGNRDVSAGMLEADAIKGLVVYEPLDAADLPTLDPLSFA
jgi:hypothetical protein